MARRLHYFQKRICHYRRSCGYRNASFFERGNLGCGGALASADDSARMAHSPSRRRRGAGDKSGDGFFAIVLNPFRRFFFRRTANFSDHDDTVGVWIFVEEFDYVEVGAAIDRITADANAS